MSVTLDCACGRTAAEDEAAVLKETTTAEAEVCSIEDDERVVAATAGGADVVDPIVCTAGDATACSVDDEVDEVARLGNALVVLLCVLTSVLGTAVHLFPPSVVMNCSRPRTALVAIL